MKKLSLTNRIIAFLKGGDEAKVARFETKLDKYLLKQISKRNEEIERLQDKIADETEVMEDNVVSIELDKINQTDGAENYCSFYVTKISNHLSRIEDLQSNIDTLEAEKARLEKVKSVIYTDGKKVAPEAPLV